MSSHVGVKAASISHKAQYIENSLETLTLFCFFYSAENEVTVKELAPYTLYEFKVMSHDRHNRSSGYSHVVECPTKEEGNPKRLHIFL